ncbi:hypothetical protein [Methanoculleus sp.]|jgi:hypothetical protein|uniref:hypothetical protein n=1 Tax=Methanoculleus sp. TaxID=90427 RepID=UPI001BD6CD48|nr:hypothetical protein [Methanoculleus sp.]
MKRTIERRIEALEQQQNTDPGVRIITLAPGEPMPEARPGEVLIIDDVSRLVAVQEECTS